MAAKKASKVMGIDRSELTGVVRNLTVDYFGNKVRIEYRPDVANAQRIREKQQEADGSAERTVADAAEQGAEELADLLVRWDVMDGDKEIPTTKENLMTFPTALLSHISDAINRDMFPNLRSARR